MVRSYAAAVAVCIGLGACAEEPVEEFTFVPETPHEQYEFDFRRANLQHTLLGQAWIDASFSALDHATRIDPPFQEVGVFDPGTATARGFRLAATRGQALIVEVTGRDGDGILFIDVFRTADGTGRPFRHVAHADSGTTVLGYAVRRTGEYVVRVQPEMLSDGRYEVTVRLAASLAFPVQGHGTEAIRSWFGAPRDGGRREHHGVDIFAPRGTPVIASAPGRVSSTRRNNLGGNVVWLRTEFGSLYHAHLDSVAVGRGARVTIGDTLGFVGNSGNARTTPPHLHFGIYARRPTDPEPFLRQPPQTPPRLVGNPTLVGAVVRTVRSLDLFRFAATDSVATVGSDVPLRVLSAFGNLYRVATPGGSEALVRADGVAPAVEPLTMFVPVTFGYGRRATDRQSPTVMTYQAGDSLAVLGAYDGQVLVRDATGNQGWVDAQPRQ